LGPKKKKFDQTTPFPLLGDLCGSPNGRENPSTRRPPLCPGRRGSGFLQRRDEIEPEGKMQSRVWTRLDQRRGGALTTGGKGAGRSRVAAARDAGHGPRARGGGRLVGGAAPEEVLVGGDGGGEAESREEGRRWGREDARGAGEEEEEPCELDRVMVNW